MSILCYCWNSIRILNRSVRVCVHWTFFLLPCTPFMNIQNAVIKRYYVFQFDISEQTFMQLYTSKLSFRLFAIYKQRHGLSCNWSGLWQRHFSVKYKYINKYICLVDEFMPFACVKVPKLKSERGRERERVIKNDRCECCVQLIHEQNVS